MAEIQTLVDLFETSCQARGNAPLFGVRSGDSFSWVSYEQIHQRVARMRRLLRELGLVRGDRVALIADNGIDWATICYAAAGCAAVTVPMYTAQRPSDWGYILRDCGAKVVFLGTKEIAATFARIRANVPDVEHAIVMDGDEQDPTSLKGRLRLLGDQTAEVEKPARDDPAGFIYTSGTTGHPKGVVLSHGNMVSNVLASASTFPLFPSDRSLSFLPWAHSLGQTVDLHLLLHVGCQIGINSDVASLMTNLTLVHPTILIAVPRVFYRIYENVQKQMAGKSAVVRRLFENGVAAATRRAQGSSLNLADRAWLNAAERLIFSKVRRKFGGNLRFVISGSAALNRDVAEFVNALGIEVFEGYGLTEASPVVSVNTPDHRKFGTVGRAIPGVTITIDRSVTNHAEDGEIVVRGPNVMSEYYGAPEDTAKVLTSDGQLRTGDMGHLDAEGYLVITGRIKEQYKLHNGKYVVPTPLEEHFKLSPYVSNCMLFGADKPYCVLIVVPNQSAIQAEAQARGLAISRLEEDPQVYDIIKTDVTKRAKEFHAYMRPKKLLILSEDFTVENGLLTPSMKVRRQEIISKYNRRLAKLYADLTPD